MLDTPRSGKWPDVRSVDLLHLTAVRTLSRSGTHRVLQAVMLALAALLVVHGLTGPVDAPRNLATVLTWIHYRGLLIVALLAIGNLFCATCPMMLVRDVARRFVHPIRRWPRMLRNKWLAVALFASFLFLYEYEGLWNAPRATALIIVGYFAAALVVDLLFTGATFCKYVCPIGQFNFVAATMSPFELQVRERSVCRDCTTVDCIKGRPAPLVARGCELGLFLPGKVGNLDCTLCFDCVRACPHDNIALELRTPGVELLDPRRRAGLGRLTSRPDMAALAVLFTFGALTNAFAMTDRAMHAQHWMMSTWHLSSDTTLAVLFAVALVVAPLTLIAAAAFMTRLLENAPDSWRSTLVRHSFTLVPLGAGVWLAHYGFHALTGALTFIPVTQSAVVDLFGRPWLGHPLWHLRGLQPGLVTPLQWGCVLLGAFGSVGLAHAIRTASGGRNARAALPWTLLIAGLTWFALWTLTMPMAMRGMMMPG